MELLRGKEARKRFGRLAQTNRALHKLVDEGVAGIHLKAVTIDGERWFRPEAIDEFIKQLGDAVLRHVRGSLAAKKVQPGFNENTAPTLRRSH
jgi:hypothetical protein